MNFQDIIYNHAQFDCISCSDSTDDNCVTEDTQLIIRVSIPIFGIFMDVDIDCAMIFNVGTDLSSTSVIHELNWYALDQLDIPKFNVGRINK